MKYFLTLFLLLTFLNGNNKITNELNLTKEEQKWIRTHTAKIGVEQWTPILFSNNGYDIDGICGDFTKLILKRTGLKVKIVTKSWDNLLTDFKNKKLDILPDVFSTEKRKKYGLFSDSYLKIKDSIYFKETNSQIHSLYDLNGKTLAMQEGNGNIDKIKNTFPKIKIILTKSLDDSINHVLNGDVTAFYAGQIAVYNKVTTELIKGLKSVPIKSFKAPSLHFFSKIDEPLLASILQKGLRSITYKERNTIINKWLSKSDDKIILNDKEFFYLKKKRIIKMCINPNWKPIEFLKNKNQLKGISIDIISLLEYKVDIEFKYIPTKDWSQSQQYLKERKCDILPSAIKTKSREKYANFTTPYLTLPLAIFTLKNKGIISNINMIMDKPWARKKGSGLIEQIKLKYPKSNVIETKDNDDSFKLVNNEKAYFTIATLPVASNIITKYQLDNIQISGYSDIKYNISIAVRDDDKILLNILNKALSKISNTEYKSIYDKWITTPITKTVIDYTLLWQLALLFIIIIITISYWNRKLAEEVNKEKKSLEEFEYLFNNTIETIGLFQNNLCINLNDAGCQLFGFKSKEDAFGKSPIYFIADDSIHMVKSKLQNNDTEPYEVNAKKTDGTIFPVLIKGDYKEINGILTRITSLIDLTIIKEKEKALEIEKEKAEKASKIKSEFLANMSHEIRTPINAIIGMNHLAINLATNKSQKDYLYKVDHSSHILLGLINNILDISKIEANKLTLDKSDFLMKDILHYIKNIMQIQADNKNIKLIIFDIEENCVCYGDSLRLSQILTNLVSNAIKFTKNGTVEVNLTRISDDRMKLIVKDTGIGISEDNQNKLFESFSQADTTITKKYGGTGLGLAITKKLVLLMNGTITVNSTLNIGSEFICEIELQPGNKSEIKQITNKENLKELTDNMRTLKGSNILLVEDNEINQELIINLLKPAEINIDIANNGQEAIDMYNTNKTKYELILMDLQMPIMDGITATKIIRKDNLDIPIIACTANVMTEHLEQTKIVLMNEHLSKPIDVKELYRILLKYIPKKVKLNHIQNKKELSEDDMPNFEYIDKTIGLQSVVNNKQLYIKLLKDFFNNYKDLDLNSLNEFDFKRTTHTVKGLSATLGFMSLYKITKDLDETQNKEYLDSFYIELNKVLEELDKLKSDNHSNDKNIVKLKIDDKKLSLLYNELNIAIKTYRPQKCKPIIDNILEYKLNKEDIDKIDKIKSFIEKYEFDNALKLL